MTLGEYMEETNLDFCDVILKNEEGKTINNPGCLIDNCTVITVEDNAITIR